MNHGGLLALAKLRSPVHAPLNQADAGVVDKESHARVHAIGGLTRIYDEDCNVVVLARKGEAFNERLDAEFCDHLRHPLLVRGSRGTSVHGALVGRVGSHEALDALAADIDTWTEVYCDLLECAEIGVRIVAPDAAMCPAFHVDKVVLRAVMTYVGRGTQYLSNGDVQRAALGSAPALVARPGAVIWMAQVNEWVLLKGEAWPNNRGGGAVHRSPTVEQGRRLVVTWDALGF